MSRKPDPYGRDARRPYHIPLRGWWQVAQRVWTESGRDNLSVISAGCAFFALFAIFPALSALIALYGLTANPTTVEQQFGMLADVLPAQAYDIVIEQVRRLVQASGQTLGWSLAVSLLLAFWSATAGTQALFAALNIATGKVIGMRTFGASAPLKELLRKFGFSPDKVVEAAREAIADSR